MAPVEVEGNLAMVASVAARSEALQWIYDLPPRSLFRGGDVPGDTQRRYEILSRLCAAPEPVLERIARGFYFKRGRPGGLGIEYTHRQCLEAVCAITEPGGGPAEATALNLLGWSLQQPARYIMSTCASEPPRTTPMRFVEWRCDAPKHRRDLTWAEVALIEGAQRWFTDDTAWDDALVSISDRSAFRRMPDGVGIHPDRLEEAARFERPTDLETHLRSAMGSRSSLPPLDVRLQEMVNACRSAGF